MKKVYIAIFSILLFNLCLFAQTSQDDFSGTWILDEKESFKDKKRREDIENYQMLVDDQGQTLMITQSYIWKNDNYNKEILLNTDKSGDQNSYFINNQKVKEVESKSYRKDNKIYREYFEESLLNKLTTKYEVTEKYSLSKKKDKLILEVKKKLIASSDPRFSQALSSSRILDGIFDYKNQYVFRLKK